MSNRNPTLAEIMRDIQMHEGIESLRSELSRWSSDNMVAILIPRTKLHPTEEKYPEMTARFREIIEEMYQTFLAKNNDYSRWNILATGIVGITTRFWDKTARIMNLVGFNIGTGEYTGPKKNLVEDERIDQTFLDASVYGIIARIYIEGKWGK